MQVLAVNGEVVMCDKCNEYPMQYAVQGLTELSFYDGLCGKCCAQWLRDKGDTIGAQKFD